MKRTIVLVIAILVSLVFLLGADLINNTTCMAKASKQSKEYRRAVEAFKKYTKNKTKTISVPAVNSQKLGDPLANHISNDESRLSYKSVLSMKCKKVKLNKLKRRQIRDVNRDGIPEMVLSSVPNIQINEPQKIVIFEYHKKKVRPLLYVYNFNFNYNSMFMTKGGFLGIHLGGMHSGTEVYFSISKHKAVAKSTYTYVVVDYNVPGFRTNYYANGKKVNENGYNKRPTKEKRGKTIVIPVF